MKLSIRMFFYCGSNLPKSVPKNYPEHYPSKEKMLRIVIWHIFLKIGAKVKNILRLSHLYKGMKHLVGWISDSRPWSFFWKLPLGLIQTKCFKLSREKKCTSFIHHDKKMSNKSYLLRPSIICTAMSNKRKKMLLGPAMNFNAIRHLMQM